MTKRTRALFLMLATAAFAVGCSPGQGVKVGPFPVSFDLGSGTFTPDKQIAGTKGTTTYQFPLCNLPSVRELDEFLEAHVDEAVARFVSLSDIIVDEVTLIAVDGDFSTLTGISVFFVPKPVNGQQQVPVLLGLAASVQGFGIEVNLQPLGQVDLLDLIRANDENPTEACPTILAVITGEVPQDAIDWIGMLHADVFGELRLGG